MPEIALKPQQQIEFLKCFYTPEERAELSERLCRAIALKAEKEEEFKQIRIEYKEAIEAQQLEINRLGRRLNFGYEHKHVACDVILNSPAAGKKTIIRADIPGEVVRVVEMDSDEQLKAPAQTDKLFEIAPEKVVEQVNAGALDAPEVKCTAEITPAESTAEEIARTRKSRKAKMQGQDAILPDKRTEFPHGANAGDPGVH